MFHSTILSEIYLRFIDLSYFDLPFLVKLNVNFTALQGISEFLISSLLMTVSSPFNLVSSNWRFLFANFSASFDSYFILLTGSLESVFCKAYTNCERTQPFVINILKSVHFVTETAQYIHFPSSSQPCTKCLCY